jgi:hypothetical protein
MALQQRQHTRQSPRHEGQPAGQQAAGGGGQLEYLTGLLQVVQQQVVQLQEQQAVQPQQRQAPLGPGSPPMQLGLTAPASASEPMAAPGHGWAPGLPGLDGAPAPALQQQLLQLGTSLGSLALAR